MLPTATRPSSPSVPISKQPSSTTTPSLDPKLAVFNSSHDYHLTYHLLTTMPFAK
jgi:hypothetical protein